MNGRSLKTIFMTIFWRHLKWCSRKFWVHLYIAIFWPKSNINPSFHWNWEFWDHLQHFLNIIKCQNAIQNSLTNHKLLIDNPNTVEYRILFEWGPCAWMCIPPKELWGGGHKSTWTREYECARNGHKLTPPRLHPAQDYGVHRLTQLQSYVSLSGHLDHLTTGLTKK